MQTESRPDAAPQPAPATATQDLASVVRLRPIRTLVISPDQAFRARAVTVLSALGPVSLAVNSLAEVEDIASLRSDRQADVVLLDATDCEATAREIIATLAAAAPRTGVLVVCQHSTDAARTLRALPKWGWTKDLLAGVELAYGEAHPLAGVRGAQRRRTPWQRMAGPLRRG